MHNSQYKERAQGQLDQFQLQRAQYIRSISMKQGELGLQKAGIASDSEVNQSGWGNFLSQNANNIGKEQKNFQIR